MHNVNLDLLRTTPHHPDGRVKDPQAHHRAEYRARLRADRRARWSARLLRLVQALTPRPAPALPGPALPLGSNTRTL